MSDDWDNPAGEVIESTTEAMKNIAGDQWDGAGDGWNFIDIVRDIAGIRISFASDDCRINLPPFTVDGMELLDVLFGPIQLI
jgi:hypothetical protein